MNKLILNNIEIKNNRVDYYFRLEGHLQKYFRNENHMFIEYNFGVEDIPKSILSIPFVSNVIPLMWITDSAIELDELDESFFECLNDLKAAYQAMFPSVKFNGAIMPKNIVSNSYVHEKEAASLFSGGLDALTTFIRIKDKNPLLITEYGWYENEITYSDVWEADKQNAVDFGKRYGLDNILIQSNYGTFLKAEEIDIDFKRKLGDSWWHGLHHGLAIISAAIPIAYLLKVKCLYIASSNSPLYKVTCASDPTVDNKIKFASGKVFHDAYELTRQDKVKVVVDYSLKSNEKLNIRVCFKNEENCCKCEKCLRTILGILAEGENPLNYGFNISDNMSDHIKKYLYQEVKFFTDTFITIYWNLIQNRMRENYSKIINEDLLDWFLDFDFVKERKRALLRYRIRNFMPILKRKLKMKLDKKIVSN